MCKGGTHTLVAAALTKEAYDRGEIEKELYDKKWEVPLANLFIQRKS